MRTSTYTDAIASEILDRIKTGEPMAAICRDAHMPGVSTFHDWLGERPDLAASYAKAREIGFDAIAADCMAIANSPVEGVKTVTKGDGSVEETRDDMLGHRKLQIETRLKLLAKWDPKRYGEKLDVNATVAGEIRIVVGGDTE